MCGAKRPGGTAAGRANLTGVNFFNTELAAKQLELLHELVPRAARVAVFVNPANVPNSESIERSAPPAARARGLELQIIRASNSREIDVAFATFAREPPDALFVGSDGFLNSRRVQCPRSIRGANFPKLAD
jgi:ABC-type uncharacterized transport system substrate-binding protein